VKTRMVRPGLALLVLVACFAQLATSPRLSSKAAQPLASALVSPQAPTNISASEMDSRYPALAVAGEAMHVVWEEDLRVYHAHAQAGVWSAARSVAVGEQPAVAVDGQGRAHVAFVNLFGGNYEIYYCFWTGSAWTLPRNVSNTSGVSSAPAVAVAPDGTPHVVWADNTPGYSVIYHGHWDGTYWLNEPVPHAIGGAPAVAASGDSRVHVVWQDRDTPETPYEIYHSRWDGHDWTLPENLSDSPGQPSIIPSVAVDEAGRAHVGWQEKTNGRYSIYYTWGWVGFWSIPEAVSAGESEAFLPSLTTARGDTVYVGWDESTLARYRQRSASVQSWSEPIQVIRDPKGVVDLRLAADERGQLHAVWGKRLDSGRWDVFYQKLVYRLALPIIGRSWR